MGKKIRKGVFETNSSSTHSIVIPKKVKEDNYSTYDSLDHNYGFGREESRLVNNWDEKLAYTYIVLRDYNKYKKEVVSDEDLEKFKKWVNNTYSKLCGERGYIDYKPKDVFEFIDMEGKNRIDYSYVYPYVDHEEDFQENGFIKRVLEDRKFLKRFLFNMDSYITIGGDEYRGYNIKTIGFQYDYDDEDYYCVNSKGEKRPEIPERIDSKKEQKIREEYNIYIDTGEFWDKLEEYRKNNDVYLKGN